MEKKQAAEHRAKTASIGILCVGYKTRESRVISRFWYIDGYICTDIVHTQYIGSFIIFTLGARFPMHTTKMVMKRARWSQKEWSAKTHTCSYLNTFRTDFKMKCVCTLRIRSNGSFLFVDLMPVFGILSGCEQDNLWYILFTIRNAEVIFLVFSNAHLYYFIFQIQICILFEISSSQLKRTTTNNHKHTATDRRILKSVGFFIWLLLIHFQAWRYYFFFILPPCLCHSWRSFPYSGVMLHHKCTEYQ